MVRLMRLQEPVDRVVSAGDGGLSLTAVWCWVGIVVQVRGAFAHRAVAQLGSAPALGAGCRGFKSRQPDEWDSGDRAGHGRAPLLAPGGLAISCRRRQRLGAGIRGHFPCETCIIVLPAPNVLSKKFLFFAQRLRQR